jgi:hypothetical protein
MLETLERWAKFLCERGHIVLDLMRRPAAITICAFDMPIAFWAKSRPGIWGGWCGRDF